MAYCKKCGAYIPDGQSSCLACGYDEAAERKAAEEKRKREEYSGGFARQEYEAEKREIERRQRSEERQRREAERQERENRRRAEYEERRRQQQEQNKEWAEQEYQRRQSAYEEHSEFNNPAENQQAAPMRHKALAILSYISFLFILPFLLCRDDEFAVYHAKQGAALTIFSVISTALAAVPVIGWVFPLAKVYLMVKGIINAAQDKMEPLPYIGKYMDR